MLQFFSYSKRENVIVHNLSFYVFFFKVYLCILRDREHRQRERGRERIPSGLRDVSTEPNSGLKPMNHQIMIWAEIKSQMLNQLSHPDAPVFMFIWILIHSTFYSSIYVFIKSFLCLFIFERDKRVSRRGAERKRDTESGMGSRLWAVAGLKLTNPDIMT